MVLDVVREAERIVASTHVRWLLEKCAACGCIREHHINDHLSWCRTGCAQFKGGRSD